MIDDSSPCFSAKSVAWVKKISAHHTFRVPRKALTSNLFSLGWWEIHLEDWLVQEGESKITWTCTSRLMNTDGNVTYTFVRLHASIALESWILKVRIIHRFPLFYTSKGMKSLTDIKSLHPCGWTEELSMPPPPTPLVGKAGVYIPLLSISFIRFLQKSSDETIMINTKIILNDNDNNGIKN